MTPSAHTEAVIAEVAAIFGRSASDLKSHRRSRGYALPRQMAYAAVQQAKPTLSLAEIGRAFGGRDHTTILHGIRVHHARVAWGEVLISIGDGVRQPDLFARSA